MNLIEIFERFPTQESCVSHLEEVRWKGKPKCPYCNSHNNYRHSSAHRFRHFCKDCTKSFSVTVGTIFHDSRLPMQKWFLAIALISNAKKGISAKQLQRDLKVSYKTAWSVGHRIRKAMDKEDNELLVDIIEMDETYVGGRPRRGNKKNSDGTPKYKRGRGTKKIPVVGMMERGGRVRAFVQDKARLTYRNLSELVRQNVDLANSTLYTDEYCGYKPMKQIIAHAIVNHQKEYVCGDVHTNGIEGFWSMLKRGIIGQYHKVSIKFLQKYVDEFAYKFSNRHEDDDFMFNDILGEMLNTAPVN